jgi:hypothetical protein
VAPEDVSVAGIMATPATGALRPRCDGLIGTAAAEHGYRVRYTLASKLVNELA